MNFQQINYALAVSELQSFGKAAAKCFVTQSTLSTMVARLETELDIQLFDRNTKPITTTQEGVKVLQQFRIIIKELDNLTEVVNELKGEQSGQLRIGVIPTIAPYLLPLFLNEFVQKHPKIQFIVSELTTENILKDLENRELDIGILSTPLQHSSLIEVPLYNEPFLLFDGAEAALLTASKKPVNVNEIDCSRLWLLNEGHCLRTQIETICDLQNKRAIEWNLEYKSGTIDTLMKFVKKHEAVTLLPYLATVDFTKAERSHLFPIQTPQPVREVSLVVHQHFVKKVVLESLKSAILEVIQPLIAQHKQKEWLVAPV